MRPGLRQSCSLSMCETHQRVKASPILTVVWLRDRSLSLLLVLFSVVFAVFFRLRYDVRRAISDSALLAIASKSWCVIQCRKAFSQ